MNDEYEAVPPPYTSDDPLRSSILIESDHLQIHAGNRGVPSYEHAVREDGDLPYMSAELYFEEHPAPERHLQGSPIRHTISLSPQSDETDLSFIPRCWEISSADVTRDDIFTFANYLFAAQTSQVFVHGKLWDVVDRESESWRQRTLRFENVVAEWNEGFFGPRGLLVHLDLEDGDPTYDAPTRMSCAECARASQVVLNETPRGRPSPQLREATVPAKNLSMAACHPVSSRLPLLDLAIGLAAQAASHHIQPSARQTSNCSRRQTQTQTQTQTCHSHSHRRHCGPRNVHSTLLPTQHAMGSSFPPTTLRPPPITAPSSQETTHHPHLATLISTLDLNSFTTTTMTSKDFRTLKSHICPLLLNKAQRRALKAELKTLKREIEAAARQVKAERREEARGRGGGGCGKGVNGWKEKEVERRRWERGVERRVSGGLEGGWGMGV